MTSDLARHINDAVAINTHEHTYSEEWWLKEGPRDVLACLFTILDYWIYDMISAGMDQEVLARLGDGRNPDIEGRWKGAEKFWRDTQHTGYGEAGRYLAKEVYGIDEITPASLRAAQPIHDALLRPGERLRLMRDVAKLDHIQIDGARWDNAPDLAGPGFFLSDLSVRQFASGRPDYAKLAAHTGVEVHNLATLGQAMEGVFEKYGKISIATKTQHAYDRTLRWEKRSDEDAGRAMEKMRARPDQIELGDRLCLGDWCLDRAAALSGQHNLPLKIHCGYLTRNGHMLIDGLQSGLLCPLIQRHPKTRFVLMHLGYPYGEEQMAVVKHYANAYSDLCWAWATNPYSTVEYVRRFIHGAPSNKLFAYGGDTITPVSTIAFGLQMRKWLTKALEAEVADGELTESQAIDLASRFLSGNARECFDVERTRANIRRAMACGTQR